MPFTCSKKTFCRSVTNSGKIKTIYLEIIYKEKWKNALQIKKWLPGLIQYLILHYVTVGNYS